MTQPEALRLADELSKSHLNHYVNHAAAAELRRLHDDAEESDALRERLSALLKSTAIALRGPEPKLTSYGWHDLPERVAALKSQRDELLEALTLIAETDPVDAALDPQRSVRIARAAIAKAEKP